MFNRNVKVAVSKTTVKEKSMQALSMFRSAIKTLTESNDQANGLMDGNELVMERLSEENKELDILVKDNEKIVSNIQKLIGE